MRQELYTAEIILENPIQKDKSFRWTYLSVGLTQLFFFYFFLNVKADTYYPVEYQLTVFGLFQG